MALFCCILGSISSSVWHIFKAQTNALNRSVFFIAINCIFVVAVSFGALFESKNIRRVVEEDDQSMVRMNVNSDQGKKWRKKLKPFLVSFFLKISRASFFSHNALIIWYYAKARQVIYIDSFNYVS